MAEHADLHTTGAYARRVPHLRGLASPVLGRFARERLALLGRLVAPGARVIDAGAGQGRFVSRAREAGYDAWGFDPHPRGDAVAEASFDDAPVQPGSADAVTLWHVLEHVPDSGAALDRARDWLRPQGGLIVAVPNLASWQAAIGGERWFHLDVPRHRLHFTPEGLARLLAGHGFEVIAVEHRLLEHNPYGLWQTVLNRLGRRPSWLFSLLKGNARWNWGQALLVLALLPLFPVAVAVERVAAARRRGGTVVVLARRRDPVAPL
ncbi:MAG TPA: class I SAM-dependent methyltransferase [Solirubrobacteraceae bacterium]|nr:class I SAM-dependent methyltransferase [Solirubrobacteraceae bacterium]